LRPRPPGGGLTRSAVVTGVGTVGALGIGVEALARSLREGPPVPVPVDRAAGYHRRHGARTALAVGDADLGALVPAARARRMSPPARFAVAALRLALADAGLAELPGGAHADTGVVAGTAFGPAFVTELLLRQILHQGPDAASPVLFTESVASAAASQMALTLGARGPNLALTQREASDLLALAEATRLIETGAAPRVLVTVVDEMIPLLHAVLDRYRALATATDAAAGSAEVARPFDRRRNGLIAAEGACVLLLESAELAAERGAPCYARVAATARGFDPSAPSWDWGDGDAGLAATLGRALERAGVEPRALERVVSGASGSRRGDRLEAAVLHGLFGDDVPPVLAPKGSTGEYGGAFLAAAVLVAAGHAAPPTRGFAEVDPELGIRPWQPAPGSSPAAPPPARRTLVSALASGGAAAWVVLERGDRTPPPAARAGL
jgi:3-oxoacyl-[acyl-carrier-protein] synthase II